MSEVIEQQSVLIPEQGWSPADFPQLTAAFVPYTSNPQMRADPWMTITADGWLFIEVGTLRLAIPDEEEWNKLVHMVTAMWNTHRQQKQQLEQQEDNHDSADRP